MTTTRDRHPRTRRPAWLPWLLSIVLSLAAIMPVRATDPSSALPLIRTLLISDPQRLADAGLDVVTLARIYRHHGFVPLWASSAPQRAAANRLLERIARAGEEGLDPAAFHLAALQQCWNGQDPRDRAWRDLLLTDAFLRLASQLKRGRFDPQEMDPDWFIEAEPFAPEPALERALAVGIDPVLDGLAPHHPGYRRLRDALARYRAIAAAGGWPTLAEGPALRLGSTGPAVERLRQRLQATGDIRYQSPTPGEFDEVLAAAVRHFQQRMGLPADGVVGRRTRHALNVPVTDRIHQIELNMERWRWLPSDLGERYILVNLAGFYLEAVADERPVLRMRVIVGRRYRSTPAFTRAMTYLVLNPYWNVPRRIAVHELLPRARRDPGFLQRKGIRILDGWQQGPRELAPGRVDLAHLDPADFPYRLRQDPGPTNALGSIKFMLPNPFDIYLHDTPSRHLFQRPVRTFSHGCIRIEKPLALAGFVLSDGHETPLPRLESLLERGANRTLRLPRPVPVYLLYLTAWVDEQGNLNFRPDVYGRNRRLATLFGRHAS